jgi:hypothetical protein
MVSLLNPQPALSLAARTGLDAPKQAFAPATLTALSLGGSVWLNDHEAKRFGQTKPLGHGVAA